MQSNPNPTPSTNTGAPAPAPAPAPVPAVAAAIIAEAMRPRRQRPLRPAYTIATVHNETNPKFANAYHTQEYLDNLVKQHQLQGVSKRSIVYLHPHTVALQNQGLKPPAMAQPQQSHHNTIKEGPDTVVANPAFMAPGTAGDVKGDFGQYIQSAFPPTNGMASGTTGAADEGPNGEQHDDGSAYHA